MTIQIMKVRTRTSLLITMFLLLLPTQNFGQQKPWVSPDKTFSVEVPVTLRKEETSYYGFILFGPTTGDSVFLVYIYRPEKKKRKLSFKDKVDGLEYVLGGDDDHDFSETYKKINGLDAKEIVYKKQNKKGLLIDAGDKTYILGFGSKTREELDSPAVKAFFTSFRLLKTKK